MIHQVKVSAIVQDCGDGSFSVQVFPNREEAEKAWCEFKEVDSYPEDDSEINAFEDGIIRDEVMNIEIVDGVPRLASDFCFSSD